MINGQRIVNFWYIQCIVITPFRLPYLIHRSDHIKFILSLICCYLEENTNDTWMWLCEYVSYCLCFLRGKILLLFSWHKWLLLDGVQIIIMIIIIITIITISKFSKSDWSSAALIWAIIIVQLHTSCACNCTVVRFMPEQLDIKLAHASCTWMGSFSASCLEVEYINLSNSLYYYHILLEFCYSYDWLVIGLRVVQFRE